MIARPAPLASRRFWLRLGLIVAAGVAIRVFYTVFVAPWPPKGLTDEFFYSNVAQFVAQGRGFIEPGAAFAGRSVATAGHPPLYVVVLAGLAKLGGTGATVQRLAGSVFGAGTITVLGVIGRRTAGNRAGLLTAGVAAAYPILVGADGALMSESLFGLLIACSLLTAYRLWESPDALRAATFGAVVGLAALTRGEAVLLLGLVLIPLVRRPRGGRSAVIAVLVLIAVLTPWTVRNWIVLDSFVPIATNGATLIAGANCQSVYYGSGIGSWNPTCIKPYPGNEATQAAKRQSEGLRYAEHHLARLPLVAAARLARVWSLYAPGTTPMGRSASVQEIGVAMYFLLLPLGLFGFLTLRRRRYPTWILMTPFILVSAVALLTAGDVRFREPADVALVVLAGIALDELWNRVEANSRLRAVTAAS